jgi:lysozyme family protein
VQGVWLHRLQEDALTERTLRLDPTSQFYSSRFNACLTGFTLGQEGGESNDAHDPGGRTLFGIIQSEYDRYRRIKNLTTRSVWKADDIEIQEIYWTQYWQPNCPRLWAGLDLCFFDQSVNEGGGLAVELLQQALGVDADRHFGMQTLAAVNAVKDRADFIKQYSALRLGFYRHLRNFKYFGRGWTRREDECEVASLAMLNSGTKQAVAGLTRGDLA